MRDHLILYVNGARHEVRGRQAFDPLSTFLRAELRLTGTKVVCAEGDCGACSVLIDRPTPARPGEPRSRFRAVDSCILFLHQLDLCHVITVEGLARDHRLHPVQQAMIDHFGSQCGFCTPGFVTTLAGLIDDARGAGAPPSRHQLQRGLSGNLCRCTGYLQILEAAKSIDAATVAALEDLVPAEGLDDDHRRHGADSLHLLGDTALGPSAWVPATLAEASALLVERPASRVVAGATDLGVRHNKGLLEPRDLLVLSDRIPGFSEVSIEENLLVAGAGATWSRVLEAVTERVPELARILEVFGAPQIRHLATVGGNLVNASPIADSLPFFFAVGATLDLFGPDGERRVLIEDFYLGYKRVDLRPGELVARVLAPLPVAGERLRLFKMSKRRDLDISSFTAGLLLTVDAGRIRGARIAMGGVAPVVLRLPKTEAALVGEPVTEATFRRAGTIARDEIAPITDVRGSARYRRQLAENVMLKVYFETFEAEDGAELALASSRRT